MAGNVHPLRTPLLGGSCCPVCGSTTWRARTPPGWAQPTIRLEDCEGGPWTLDDHYQGHRVGLGEGHYKLHRCDGDIAIGDDPAYD